MISLHRDPHYTFRFAEDRLIPRFHLEGAALGSRVVLRRFGVSSSGQPLLTAIVAEGGWVELVEPIVVRAGEGFTVVVEELSPGEWSKNL